VIAHIRDWNTVDRPQRIAADSGATMSLLR
jgi:hypothetical protein